MIYDRYSAEEVRQFVEEDDVKFIRLAYTDIFGRPSKALTGTSTRISSLSPTRLR